MSESSGIDSDGLQHLIWLQDKPDTCGPACIYMIERDRRQASIVGAEERITDYTSLLPDGYMETEGTQSYKALKTVMDRIGLASAAMVVPSMADFVRSGFFPFIARVGWANGGGHFVVGWRITSGNTLVCLDPFYGLTEQAMGTMPAYSAAQGARLSGHVVFPNAST